MPPTLFPGLCVQGLVTVCNHVAAMDDPLVMSTLVPSHFFDQPSSLRCVWQQSLRGAFVCVCVRVRARGACGPAPCWLLARAAWTDMGRQLSSSTQTKGCCVLHAGLLHAG